MYQSVNNEHRTCVLTYGVPDGGQPDEMVWNVGVGLLFVDIR